MKKTKASVAAFRISKSAVGKILAGIITSAGESGMDALSFQALMIAANEYMMSGTTTTDSAHLPEEWTTIKDSIDKAAIRSAKARERAARRREAFEAGAKIPSGAKSEFRTKSKTKSKAAPKHVAVRRPWSPSRVPMPSHSLEDFRDGIRRVAKRSGKNVDYLDRLPVPCNIANLHKIPTSILKRLSRDAIRKICMQYVPLTYSIGNAS